MSHNHLFIYKFRRNKMIIIKWMRRKDYAYSIFKKWCNSNHTFQKDTSLSRDKFTRDSFRQRVEGRHGQFFSNFLEERNILKELCQKSNLSFRFHFFFYQIHQHLLELSFVSGSFKVLWHLFYLLNQDVSSQDHFLKALTLLSQALHCFSNKSHSDSQQKPQYITT